MSGLDRFHLDGYLFTICYVNAKVDVTKGSRPDLANQPVLSANDEFWKLFMDT